MKTTQPSLSLEEMVADVQNIPFVQDNLAFFSQYVSGGWYVAHAMHFQIAEALQRVMLFLETDGSEGTQFLMILTPPQHGKSAMTSQFFPAWALGRMPNLRITEVSYGDALATKNSRYTRNIILSSQYQAVFGAKSPVPLDEQVMLSGDSRSMSSWDLAAPNRGGMIATGVGGALTGQPKGLCIIDDPIKDYREAQNKAIRDDVWEFYKSSLRVRAKAIVLIVTRWHPDDLAGRLLKMMTERPDTDQWEVLDMPAIIEQGLFAADDEEQRKSLTEGVYKSQDDILQREMGETLCEPLYPKSEILKIKATDPYYYSALFQQRPYPKDGQKYRQEWFRTVRVLPEGVTIKFLVRYWDKANSTSGDWTVGVLMAYCSDGLIYVLDVVRGRWSSFERDSQMGKTGQKDFEKYGKVATWHQQDPGSAGKDSAQATTRKLLVEYGVPSKFETVSGDKETRSEPMESSYQAGLIVLILASWNEEYRNEHIAFPRGEFDDQVDAGSSAHNKILQMIGKPQKQVRSYQG